MARVDLEKLLRQQFGPAWRFHAAEAEGGENDRSTSFDAVVRRAADYFRRRAAGGQGAADVRRRDRQLDLAVAAWNNATTRLHLQVLILGNVSPGEIATLLDMPQRVVQLVEALYFDVRPLLEAPHLIVAGVINPELIAGRPDAAARMRAAYLLGPEAAKRIVRGRFEVPMDGLAQIEESGMLLHARVTQVLAGPLNDEQTAVLLQVVAAMQIARERLQLDREKFLFRMRRWAARNERRAAGDVGLSTTFSAPASPL